MRCGRFECINQFGNELLLKQNDKARIARLEKMLTTLRLGKNVQNRQLQTWLSEEAFAQFEDDWREQQKLREELKDKPDAILEYEKRLMAATFTYSKADSADLNGRAAATHMFADARTKLERLREYLQEKITGNAVLEQWLDRNVHYNFSNTPHTSRENFPCVITSRSLRNLRSGMLVNKRTKLQVKIGVVERELVMLTRDDVDELVLLAKRQAAMQKMRKFMGD